MGQVVSPYCIMIDSVTLFDLELPIYGLCYYAGIGLAAVAAYLLVKVKQVFPPYDLIYSAVYALIGGMIGSKLLFIIVSWRDIIRLQLPFEAVLKGGFVFYGGLIGGAVGLWIYTLQFKMALADFTDVYATVIPLGHAVGRVGCFFGGCCYGMEYHGPCAVVYTETVGTTPLDTPLLPVQLIEALLLISLFTVFAYLYCRKGGRHDMACLYLISYGAIRFILEFFRGDAERGLWLGISTGQIISMVLIMCALLYMLKKKA